MTGQISSIETMGLVDGPGIRVVIFMQGCMLRCLFCHNPETWSKKGNIEMTPEEVVNIVLKYKNYFGTDGGVTFSGGEPLMQPKFLLETLKLCKKKGINTCLDTAGVGTGDYSEILKYVDLVLLDIKAIDNYEYQKITNQSINMFNEFITELNKSSKDVWIRQVIIPGINDNIEYILKLKEYIKKFKNVKKIELLPYHNNAITKYEKLGMSYKLIDVPNMDKDYLSELYKELIDN